jgi:hypothetical protein
MKLMVAKLVKKILPFLFGTRSFIALFMEARH